jgi:lactate dehydrogenase-like 2-hydroxyacid dehydrogenase
MRVLATRRLPGPAWDDLTDVELLPAEGLVEPHRGVEALVVANESVGARELGLLPDLRLVANYGVGYDRVDVDACRQRGVTVSNTPGVLDASTADLAFALILAARRGVIAGDRLVRAGAWEHGWSATRELAEDVSGATLGIVGLGRIGRAVAARGRGFDVRILYSARTRHPGEHEYEWRELDDLLREADIVTLHAPRTRDTEGLIGAQRLGLLRDGATFVNTARGELVEEPALVRELVSGRINAGLDVFAHEPHVPRELLELPNVVLTPHIGSATVTTRHAMTRLVVDNILALERGEPPLTPV